TIFLSCEKLEIVRTMDTKTDNVEINSSAVVAYGTVLDIGDSKIIQHGHCWSTTAEPTVDHFKSELGAISERDTFTSHLTKIVPGFKHYLRSYIYDGTNYVYGNILSFTISSEDIDLTSEINESDDTSVIVNSSVNNIGSINFNDHGHCWSQIDPPTVDDNITSYGQIDTNISFTSDINGLNLGRYFIRGYLISEGKVIYSNTIAFESKITLTTDSTTTVNSTSIIAYGTINSLGIEAIHDHGFCWSSTDSDPHYLGENTSFNSLGSADKLGSFICEINNLEPNSTYYITSYAIDGINDLFYGEVEVFKTPAK
ncbi:MAG: hypothetical protein ABFS35_19105, partial [Bacteroidota bacterium]